MIPKIIKTDKDIKFDGTEEDMDLAEKFGYDFDYAFGNIYYIKKEWQ